MSISSSTTTTTTSKNNCACVICFLEYDRQTTSCYSAGDCTHWMCKNCSKEYFQSLLKDAHFNCNDGVMCPGFECKQIFSVDGLDTIYSEIFTFEEERDWWNTALVKTFIEHEVHCPMKDCQGIFDANQADMEQCTFAECYECHRALCVACDTPWNEDHEEHGANYQAYIDRKNDEAIWKEHNQTLDLAEEMGWARCPKCAHIISIVAGCNNVLCRCGTQFCFHCGRHSTQCRDQCYNMVEADLNNLRATMFDH